MYIYYFYLNEILSTVNQKMFTKLSDGEIFALKKLTIYRKIINKNQ